MVHRSYALNAGFAKVFLLSFFASLCLMLAFTVVASPGAHGPNGEHLDMEQSQQQDQQPKFEAFTESFELLAEVFPQQLIIYLHDFETNVPVKGANIELETGTLSATASFDEAKNHYVVANTDFLSMLNSAGEHEVIATVLTENNSDLLLANFVVPDAHSNDQHAHDSQNNDSHHNEQGHAQDHEEKEEKEEHHHFPWWALALAIGVFILGFVIGRRKKGVQS